MPSQKQLFSQDFGHIFISYFLSYGASDFGGPLSWTPFPIPAPQSLSIPCPASHNSQHWPMAAGCCIPPMSRQAFSLALLVLHLGSLKGHKPAS